MLIGLLHYSKSKTLQVEILHHNIQLVGEARYFTEIGSEMQPLLFRYAGDYCRAK